MINNPANNHFLYRGLAHEEYELIPSVFRKSKEEYDNFIYLSWATELGLLQQFIQEASAYVNIPSNDYLHWAEYAQHFGVPTRLLDWTSNPLVALYFACKDRKKDNAIVWALNSKNYDSICKPQTETTCQKSRGELVNEVLRGKSSFDYPLIYTPSYVDLRMSAQSSFFMVWGKQEKCLEQLFADEKYWMVLQEKDTDIRFDKIPKSENILFALKILADMKQPIIHELDSLGINEKTLFPGLDGIGRYIERKNRFDYKEQVRNF